MNLWLDPVVVGFGSVAIGIGACFVAFAIFIALYAVTMFLDDRKERREKK